MVSNDFLRRDVRMLGDLLGSVIAEQAGAPALTLVEEVRQLARDRRAGSPGAEAALASRIAGLCKRLSALPEERATGRVYRLPTEAEWEYACRAGSNAPFGFGGLELSDDYGWFNSNSQGLSQPVGQKEMSDWGLYDMHGNVMEWCSDWAGDYPEGAVSDPTGPMEGFSRMIRGGAWLTPAMTCKSGSRAFHFPPDTRSDYLGFRVALSSPEVSDSPEPSPDKSNGAGRN